MSQLHNLDCEMFNISSAFYSKSETPVTLLKESDMKCFFLECKPTKQISTIDDSFSDIPLKYNDVFLSFSSLLWIVKDKLILKIISLQPSKLRVFLIRIFRIETFLAMPDFYNCNPNLKQLLFKENLYIRLRIFDSKT